MKKILSLTLVSSILLFSGCCFVKSNDYYTDKNGNTVTTEFNEEHYIWENWFNTNDQVK